MNTIAMKVFINPSCGPCINLKKWLKEKQIPFIERDLINDVSAAKEFRSFGGKFTPTTIIETEKKKFEIIGANTKKIEKILSELNFLLKSSD